MRYLSLFSGIEAATAAWQPIGWQCAGFSEIEPFPCAVLKHHYPSVPNLGDVTKITETQIKKLGQIDLVVFGSPCQDLSIAGQRKGFDGERSSLFRDAIRIIKWARKHNGCRFALWENVPGAFSSNKGSDFAEVLKLLTGTDQHKPEKWRNAGVAFGKEGLVEWRVCDAQFFGVPQRRRRIFALADFGDWTGREPILFEPPCLSGDSAPGSEAAQTVTAPLEARTGAGGFPGTDGACGYHVVPSWWDGSQISPTLDCGTLVKRQTMPEKGRFAAVLEPLPLQNVTRGKSQNGLGIAGAGDPMYTLDQASQHGMCFQQNQRDEVRYTNGDGQVVGALAAESGMKNTNYLDTGAVVRRLTPVECERLQGFADNYTRIPWKNKPADQCPDSPRYKALGNSIAMPVLVWLGQRLEAEARIPE